MKRKSEKRKEIKIEQEHLPFMDSTLDPEKRVEDLLARLTLDEKFVLSSGRAMWHTNPIERLDIPSFNMTDGPHGIAPHSSGGEECTYFPVGVCRASTWNVELSEEFGRAFAQEVREIGYHMILGPGINIQRTPLCGRNFEYETEDPHLNIEMAVPAVQGIQSQRVAACVKHFACNNQEKNKFTHSVEVGKRALEEIYLPAFKAVVRKAGAWSIMGSYNKVNGVYSCENRYLLKERLMEEWGFKGFVVSDWEATNHVTGTQGCVNAGLSLEMPKPIQYRIHKMEESYKRGEFSQETLDENVRRLLRVMFLVGLFDEPDKVPLGKRNTPEHQCLTRKIAEEGIVLLKNEGDLLPLDKDKIKKIAVLGPNRDMKFAGGGGSSNIRPPYEVTVLEGLRERCADKIEIVPDPADADVLFLVMGLNHMPGNDCEGPDRTSFDLPAEQVKFILSALNRNPRTVVILINGGPVGMAGWIDRVPAVLEAWYPGMEGGRALADIIFGIVNPSGKLPLTFPKKLSDSPAHASEKTYPGNEKVYYEEGIFVGYRYFDKKGIEPLFPFGHGLSYTAFMYNNLKVDKKQISKDESLVVSFNVTNSGDCFGKEVAQLYVQDVESTVERPVKELKRFKKVALDPGRTETVSFKLDRKDLSFYDEERDSWKAEKGFFRIHVGNSSRDIRLTCDIRYEE